MLDSPYSGGDMNFTIACEQEADGRWLAEIALLPGVMAYGRTADAATAKVQILALRVLAEQLEANESQPRDISILVPGVA